MCELDIFIRANNYLLWFLTEEEAIVEFGLTEAAADGGDGTVVRSTMIVSSEFKEQSLTSHVLSEPFKTWPTWIEKVNIYHIVRKIEKHPCHVTSCCLNVLGCRTWSMSWTTHSPRFGLNDSRPDWCGILWKKSLLWEAENTGAPSACSSHSSSTTGPEMLLHLTGNDKHISM